MIKLTWVPNTETDIDNYEVWRAPDNVNFTKIADVDHNLGDPLLFDPAIGRFFYEDATGTVDDWYKIRAEDTTGNFSAFTVSKQVGPSTPPICTLFGTVLDLDGQPNTNVQVRLRVKRTKTGKEGQFVNADGVTISELEVFTDDAGFWEADVLQEAVIEVIIPPINLEAEIIVPTSASADITTLI